MKTIGCGYGAAHPATTQPTWWRWRTTAISAKAAEACFVSQPALSAQIRELERRLGVTLFERGNRQVLPTAVGDGVIERARGVLRDMDELVAAARLDPDRAAGAVGPGGHPHHGPVPAARTAPGPSPPPTGGSSCTSTN